MLEDDFDTSIASVFSILPQSEAIEARNFVLNKLKRSVSEIEDDLIWADFSMAGAFVRGGISSISDHSTKLLRPDAPNAQINAMLRKFSGKDIEAGHIEWDAQSNLLFWFVPITPSSRNMLADKRLRGFAVTQTLFSEFLEIFNDEADLTQAEIKTIFQFIAGVRLRIAADIDCLSYETKRSHIKNACGKLFCNGQRELITKVLGQMVHFISISEGEASHVGYIEPFVEKYLPPDTDLHARRLASGRIINSLECGPVGGRPVVFAHGIMFPVQLWEVSKFLRKYDIRLIIPIREGFLESSPTSNLFAHDDLLQQTVEDTIDLIKEYIRKPCPVIGNSAGVRFAVKLAYEAPKHVSQLILLSTHMSQLEVNGRNSSRTFFDAVRELVTNSNIFKTVTWRFKKYYLNEKTCNTVLGRLFGECAADQDVLDRNFADVSTYQMFSEIYSSSVRGVAADFSFDSEDWRQELLAIRVPILIIHGEHDPLLTPAELKEFLGSSLRDKVVTVLDGGHFVGVTQGAEVWARIGQQIKAST